MVPFDTNSLTFTVYFLQLIFLLVLRKEHVKRYILGNPVDNVAEGKPQGGLNGATKVVEYLLPVVVQHNVHVLS